ncbi:hypothetical protein IW18_01210 [Flavobacterium hibernum]|uniref:Uncharacterized protein n=1 Tax=Flavobacterium hibernum TaxID=37752 RepID=A0A0D0F039_9FLAO|nr:hypothetical protein IW18_01210 [Flavobacterium hibernum]
MKTGCRENHIKKKSLGAYKCPIGFNCSALHHAGNNIDAQCQYGGVEHKGKHPVHQRGPPYLPVQYGDIGHLKGCADHK